MRVGKLLSQPATKPTLQALFHASGSTAQGAATLILSNRARQSLEIQTEVFQPTSKPRWSSQQQKLSSLALSTPLGSPLQEGYFLRSEPPKGEDSSKQPGRSSGGISDHEYQTRVGKTCRVLVDSLPEFMSKGVVDLDDLDPDHHSRSTPAPSRWTAKGLLPSLSPFLGQSLLRRSSWTLKSKQEAPVQGTAGERATFDSLYHPSIAFEFRPPLPHLGIGGSDSSLADANASHSVPVFKPGSGTSLTQNEDSHRGGPTICFNGRTMYVASSHLLRHALSALFHDTSLHLESARFEGRSKAGSSWPGISPYVRRSPPSSTDSDTSVPDKLVIRLRFEGISRVTSVPHTYTVIFKYEFDRKTGMIARHLVDNIQPVPGSKVWAGLSNAWGVLSPAGGGPAAGGGSAACSPKVDGKGSG